MVEITEVIIDYKRKHPGREGVDVWAHVKIASAGDRIYSYHLGGKSLLNIIVTPDYAPNVTTGGVFVTKYMMNKGRPDIYASVWEWIDATTVESAIASVWINVHALLV